MPCLRSPVQFALREQSEQKSPESCVKMLGTCAQHVPDGGSPDGGPGTGFGAAFGSPDAATYK